MDSEKGHETEPKPQLDRRSVLIVEDEVIPALYLRRVLETKYQVVGSVRSGEAAIETAFRERPDIVLMDVHLDGKIDGIEAARVIRETRRTTVVFCSAYSREELGDPVGRGYGEVLVEKPIEGPRLLRILEEHGRAPA